jgi:hypothetical protein
LTIQNKSRNKNKKIKVGFYVKADQKKALVQISNILIVALKRVFKAKQQKNKRAYRRIT